jgi:hypothetical protein
VVFVLGVIFIFSADLIQCSDLAILDFPRLCFPVQFKTLLQLLGAFTGCGFKQAGVRSAHRGDGSTRRSTTCGEQTPITQVTQLISVDATSLPSTSRSWTHSTDTSKHAQERWLDQGEHDLWGADPQLHKLRVAERSLQ